MTSSPTSPAPKSVARVKIYGLSTALPYQLTPTLGTDFVLASKFPLIEKWGTDICCVKLNRTEFIALCMDDTEDLTELNARRIALETLLAPLLAADAIDDIALFILDDILGPADFTAATDLFIPSVTDLLNFGIFADAVAVILAIAFFAAVDAAVILDDDSVFTVENAPDIEFCIEVDESAISAKEPLTAEAALAAF